MEENRIRKSFTLSPEVADALEKGAKQDGRNVSRYLEAILRTFLKVKQKPIKEPKKPDFNA